MFTKGLDDKAVGRIAKIAQEVFSREERKIVEDSLKASQLRATDLSNKLFSFEKDQEMEGVFSEEEAQLIYEYLNKRTNWTQEQVDSWKLYWNNGKPDPQNIDMWRDVIEHIQSPEYIIGKQQQEADLKFWNETLGKAGEPPKEYF